jgi:hypothetical protein
MAKYTARRGAFSRWIGGALPDDVAASLNEIRSRLSALETGRANAVGQPAALVADTPTGVQPPPLPDSIYLRFAPPGHYYSTIPDRAQLIPHQDRIFSRERQPLHGIELDDAAMLGLLDDFAPYYQDFPFVDEPRPDYRFHMDNGVYSRGDAVVLYSMLRARKPRRVVEVGSGMSTCLLLDVNRLFFRNSIELTSVDPYPERMLALIGPEERRHLTVVTERLQDVDPATFSSLRRGDILFFDSTHVAKCDSDVNHIFFDILPTIAPGVHIHFHDMFYPFEYPKAWLLEIGAAWNELYMMRTFLQYNRDFRVNLFSDYAGLFLADRVEQTIPVFMRGVGSSLWLERVEAR